MYGTRYDRGDDRGQTSHYRSSEPDYGPSGGSGVSRGGEGRAVRRGELESGPSGRDRDDGPQAREWVDAPARGWAAEVAPGSVAPAYRSPGGTASYDRDGYDAGGYGRGVPGSAGSVGSAGYRSGGADGGYGRGGPPATEYDGVPGYGGRPGYDGRPGGQPRRRPPGEEYVPRRAAAIDSGRRSANQAPRRAANEIPRRAANEPPRRSPDEDRKPGKAAKRMRRPMPLWQEMPLLLVVAFCLAVLIRTFLMQAFFIPSGSMTDTLLVGDRVMVNKVVYDMRDPKRGEIVVFSGTDSWVPEVPAEPGLGVMGKLGRTVGDLVGVTRPGEKDFIKRVVGLPGDKVSCCDAEGRVMVNGRPLDEPYVIENSPLDVQANPKECRSRSFEEVTVPPGEMFVMGDHRLVSLDARCQGPVPIKNVIGKAFVVVWPKESWATLPTPSTFDGVPAPAPLAAPAVVDGAGTGALTEPSTGIFGIVLPILVPFAVPARTRRNFLLARRRLFE
jgi:signal peptidase I